MAKQANGGQATVETDTGAVAPPVVEVEAKTVPGGGNGVQPITPKDVFDDLPNFRLRQSFDRAKTRKPLTTVGIRKPKDHEWFQTHPDTAFRYEGTMFLAKEESMSDEWYFPVTNDVVAELERLSVKGLKNVLVFWWINRKNHTAVWPVTLTDSDGRQNNWHASMQEMLSVHGFGQWCRIEAADGGYNPEIAENTDLPNPEWPIVQHFGEVMRAAFKKGGRVIDTLDHSLINRLAGRKL